MDTSSIRSETLYLVVTRYLEEFCLINDIHAYIYTISFPQTYLCYLCTWKTLTKLYILQYFHKIIYLSNIYKLQHFHKDIHLLNNYNSQKVFWTIHSTALMRRYKFNAWVKYCWSSVFTIKDTRTKKWHCSLCPSFF